MRAAILALTTGVLLVACVSACARLGARVVKPSQGEGFPPVEWDPSPSAYAYRQVEPSRAEEWDGALVREVMLVWGTPDERIQVDDQTERLSYRETYRPDKLGPIKCLCLFTVVDGVVNDVRWLEVVTPGACTDFFRSRQ